MLFALASAVPGAATGQNAATSVQDGFAMANAGPSEAAVSKSAGGDLLLVPIPQSSPSLGTGLTLVGAYFYNPNASKEPWVTGAALMATSNGSWALGAGHKMALSGDRFRLTAFGGYADVNVRFFGIGPNAGDRGVSVDMNDKAYMAFIDPQMRVAPNFYLGLRGLLVDLRASLRRDEENLPDNEIPTHEFDSRLVQIGPTAVYDSRDNSFTPRRGILAESSLLFGVGALGGDFTNERLTFAANIYRPIGQRTVFAARISGCGVSRGTPFYDLCLYGASSDLRGYETGRFRDRASWATQAEVRHRLKGRFGLAAFAGIGGIAPSLGELGDTKMLPAVGAGLRWQASKETPINLRIDFAVGRDSNALYVSVGEAF